MNRLICFLGLAFLMFSYKSFAESKLVSYKTYIQPENISLKQGDILITCNGECFRVPNLSSDRAGYFITSNDPWYAPWTCYSCGQTNCFYDAVCRRCGRSR